MGKYPPPSGRTSCYPGQTPVRGNEVLDENAAVCADIKVPQTVTDQNAAVRVDQVPQTLTMSRLGHDFGNALTYCGTIFNIWLICNIR